MQVRSADSVLGLPMRWRLGYHQAFGSRRDAGVRPLRLRRLGRLGRSATGLSVGFVTNRIGSLTTPLGDLNLFRLNRVVRECVR